MVGKFVSSFNNITFILFLFLGLLQILRENNFKQTISGVKIEDDEKITCEKIRSTMKRATHYLSSLQTSDGHWPAHLGGSLFFTPPLVSSTYSVTKLN